MRKMSALISFLQVLLTRMYKNTSVHCLMVSLHLGTQLTILKNEGSWEAVAHPPVHSINA